MRILVTGATGFIGTYLVKALAAKGHEVVGLDLWVPEDGQFRIGQGGDLVRFVRGDVRDPEAVRDAIAGCRAVFHLAAAHHDFGIDEPTYYAVNEQGSRVLCDAMDAEGIVDACFYSSCAIYGDATPPMVEDREPKPTHPYGASKLAGEKVFRAWVAKGGGRSCLVIRPTITFGPNNYANMYSLIRQVRSGRFVIAGPASNIKSLSYVENTVSATLHLWERRSAAKAEGIDAFNFIEKPDMTSRQIAETVAKALGRASAGMNIPMGLALVLAKPFDLVIALTGRNLPISSMRVRKLFRDQTKFEADKLLATGFRSPVPLAEGINRMVRWYLDVGQHRPVVWRQPPAEIRSFPR